MGELADFSLPLFLSVGAAYMLTRRKAPSSSSSAEPASRDVPPHEDAIEWKVRQSAVGVHAAAHARVPQGTMSRITTEPEESRMDGILGESGW